ncbi:MAG: hypothetical protein WBN32_01430, partial [Woeseia sp.]
CALSGIAETSCTCSCGPHSLNDSYAHGCFLLLQNSGGKARTTYSLKTVFYLKACDEAADKFSIVDCSLR